MRKLSVALLALSILVLLQAAPVMAQSWRYGGTHDIDWTSIDSTAAKLTHTDSLTGGTTGSPVLYWNHPNTKVMGAMVIAITARDTDDEAADIVDTTKDTIVATMYTAYNNMTSTGNATGYERLGETALCSLVFNTHIGTTLAASTAQIFSSPTTPLVGDVVYWRFRCVYLPTNNDDTLGVHYRVYLGEKTDR